MRYEGDKEKADQLYDGIHPLPAADVARTVVWCLDQPPTVVRARRREIAGVG